MHDYIVRQVSATKQVIVGEGLMFALDVSKHEEQFGMIIDGFACSDIIRTIAEM